MRCFVADEKFVCACGGNRGVMATDAVSDDEANVKWSGELVRWMMMR